MFLMSGKRVIVTGAGSRNGIGHATCALLCRSGASVVALDIQFDAAPGDNPWTQIICDISSETACVQAVAQAVSVLGGLDALVNNAAIVKPTRFMAIDAAEFKKLVAVNLTGNFLVTQAAVPALQLSGTGAVVNVASIAAQRGGGALAGAHYSASKGGVASLTKAAALELGALGIRVNAVNPGVIDTDMTAGKYADGARAAMLRQIPLGRVGKPDDIAKAILFLASDLSSYITGAQLDVNGGIYVH